MKMRVVSFMDPSGELFWLIKWGRKTPTHISICGWHHSLGKEFWSVQDWKKQESVTNIYAFLVLCLTTELIQWTVLSSSASTAMMGYIRNYEAE